MASDQQFCLRWNNHQNTLVSIFDSLLESGTLVDCTLAAEGRFLQAHKVVLSACSPYFAMLLREHYDKFPILILKDIKYQELQAMMNYMYRGEVNITQETLGSFLKAAESLQIRGLTDNSNCNSDNNNGIARDSATHPYHTKKLPEPRKIIHPSASSSLLNQQQHSPQHQQQQAAAVAAIATQSSSVAQQSLQALSQTQPPPPSSSSSQQQQQQQQRSRSPPVMLTQSKRYLKSPLMLDNFQNNNSKSSEPIEINNTSSTKRRKVLPPIKSEGLVVTPINPSSSAAMYNNLDVNNVCDVPSQTQSVPCSLETKANVPSPSVPPKVESPRMDVSPAAPCKLPSASSISGGGGATTTNTTNVVAAVNAESLVKSKMEMVKVKCEQFEDSYNEDTNDDSYTTEDNCENDRDENSQFGCLSLQNSQSRTNFENLTDRTLSSQDGSNSLQESPGKSGGSRSRCTYTRHQIQELEKEFNVSHYVSSHRRLILASKLNLTDRQIKVWFQNRRSKEKRNSYPSEMPEPLANVVVDNQSNDEHEQRIYEKALSALTAATTMMPKEEPDSGGEGGGVEQLQQHHHRRQNVAADENPLKKIFKLMPHYYSD